MGKIIRSFGWIFERLMDKLDNQIWQFRGFCGVEEGL